MANKDLELTFQEERETKNKVRFQEQGDKDDFAVDKLYVSKASLEKIGNPKTLKVTIKG